MSNPTGPIQVVPQGLLGFLQLKNSGNYPDVLNGDVQTVLDLWGLWMQARVQSDTVNTANLVTAGGGFIAWSTPIVVPQNELWWVENYSILATLVAADTVNGLRPITRYNGAVAVTPFGRLGTDVASQTGAAGRIMVSAEGFFLGPGAELGIFTTNTTSAGNIACLGYVRKTVLPI